MDSARAGQVLAALADAVPDGLLLWRGEGLEGNDVDTVVLGAHAARVSQVLREQGLTPAPQDPGRVLWRLLPGEQVVVDVFAEHTWSPMYPALPDVATRATRGARGLLVASPGDRLLMHAAEALAGWPLAKTVGKLTAAGREPGATESLRAAVRQDPGLAPLAAVAEQPQALLAAARVDRLPLRTAARLAGRSPQARSAVRSRLPATPAVLRRPAGPVSGRPARPLLVALSGMDGAGKSTAALTLLEELDERGEAAIVHWTRLAGDLGALGRLAAVVRRVLRRSPASPVEEAGPAPVAGYRLVDAADTGGRSGVVDQVWVVAVALSSVRAARHADRIRRSGTHVICDRWLLDALVDLQIKYGPSPLAEWVLRRGFPRPDVAVLLRIGAEQAAARKPGDQPDAVLRSMSVHYDGLSGRAGVQVLDAGRPREAVVDDVRRLLDPLA